MEKIQQNVLVKNYIRKFGKKITAKNNDKPKKTKALCITFSFRFHCIYFFYLFCACFTCFTLCDAAHADFTVRIRKVSHYMLGVGSISGGGDSAKILRYTIYTFINILVLFILFYFYLCKVRAQYRKYQNNNNKRIKL